MWMHQPRRKPSLGHKRVTAADRKRRQRNLLPHLKIFFAKTPSTERLPPFWVKPFLDLAFCHDLSVAFHN
jgi:hypothetical protein